MSKHEWPHIDDPVSVGLRLKRARLATGSSQRQLAFPGCTAVYICRIEKGDRVPSLQVLRGLAVRLGVNEAFLAFGKRKSRADWLKEKLLETPPKALPLMVGLKGWLTASPQTDPTGLVTELKREVLEAVLQLNQSQLLELLIWLELQSQDPGAKEQ